MTPEFVVSIGREAIKVLLIVILPLMGVGLIVGLLVSIFQAVTQLQEITLTFIPKILAVFLLLLLIAPWMLGVMMDFTRDILLNIPGYTR